MTADSVKRLLLDQNNHIQLNARKKEKAGCGLISSYKVSKQRQRFKKVAGSTVFSSLRFLCIIYYVL